MATPKAIVTMSDNNALPNPDAENKVNTLPGKSKAFVKKHEPEKIDKMGDKGSEENQFTADGVKKDETKRASYRVGKDAEVYEETMSDAEKAKRERIVKGMKKNAADFKSKYGSRWKSVMYATATKAAMEEVELDESMPSSVIKSKQKYAEMSDKDFADKHGSKSETELKAMAWRHGYGKDSNVYVNKVKKGSSMNEATLSAKAGAAGKDLGKPGKNFAKIVDDATERYGSKEAGKRVAGAILAKMRKEDFNLAEEDGRRLRDNLKSEGKHEEAGAIAHKYGLGRSYGPHFGMRSTKNAAEMSFHKGYDKAAILAKKSVKEDVEQIDEISKSTLGSYATKALNRGDIAARMSHSDTDDMGKIAAKRFAGVKKAVEKIAPKSPATVGKIKANVDKAREAARNRYTDKDDQGKAYYAAQKGISKVREETEDDLLNRLYESLSEANKKLMDVMLEDGRIDELLEFAMEQFNDDV